MLCIPNELTVVFYVAFYIFTRMFSVNSQNVFENPRVMSEVKGGR